MKWIVALALAVMSAGALAQPLSDDQIRQLIIKDSRAAYYSTGHPCACPEDLAKWKSLWASQRLQPTRWRGS